MLDGNVFQPPPISTSCLPRVVHCIIDQAKDQVVSPVMNIAELRELSHLGGKISILNLQNVVGAIDALLKDKKDLNEVELSWGRVVSNDSVKERYVLERLQPAVNLVKLTIRFYGGISFPNWVGDSSFSNLQVMRLSDCGNCSSLPPVGQLPALKELYVERMKVVKSVGGELYGGNQPFQCLEKLEFREMPEWEEWQPSPSGGESPDFPRLKELRLSWCPKLRGDLPTHLPSLKTLDVYNCEVLHENRASNTLNRDSLRGSLEKLTIKGCPGLSLLLESTETLPSLQMFNISDLGGKEWSAQMMHNANRLQSLTLYECSSVLSFPTNGLPTTLTSLSIQNCKKLEFLSLEGGADENLNSLDIRYCPNLVSFPDGGLPTPNLTFFHVYNCENLKLLPGRMHTLTALQRLLIGSLPNLVSFPDGGLPTPNLTYFSVDHCVNLKLLPDRMHTLTALQHLSIECLPNVVSFAQGGLPPNLQTLSIVNWDLVETLLNEQLLPATLRTLEISDVSNLKSLDGKGFEHLTSLQQLQISGCESLKFLPKEGLPASLSYLRIRGCPSLKKRCDGTNRYIEEKMALVGEALLSGSIQVLCDKISGEFIDFLRARRLDHSLVGRLKVKLMTLKAVLNDAEEKQIVDRDVGMWLDELKHAVIDAEDLVDEIDTEASRSKAKDQTKKTQVWNFPSTSRKRFNYKGMNGRIKVLFNKLEDLANQIDILRLREELRELSHLGRKISILNLQNVVGAIDALLKDKKDLNEVELSWGRVVSNDSVKERYVLERLQPAVNLVKLTIRFYGGISFPNWVGDSSFSNLQVMRLSDCGNCNSLPPVGQLPALKELYVERMKVVKKVGVELYGGNQPFQCLEKLEFGEMPEWEEWLPSPSGGESPDFPRLQELILRECPKLIGDLPTHLPSLKTLDVYKCEVLHENRASNTLNRESLRGSLEKLTIKGCPGLALLLESTETLPSLQELDISYLGGKEWLPQMVPNSNRLQSLTLWGCSPLLSFPTNGLPTTLTSLSIEYCKKLEFLSREMMAKLTSLQSLDLFKSCDSLRSFPLGIFPNLSSLTIGDCENLESLSVEEGADENLSHLNSLSISGCRNLVSFPDGGLPTPNLTFFDVYNCENLKLLPDRMHTLTALQHLWIECLPNVVSFAQGGLPPNLQSFRISRNKDLLETVLNEQLLPATLHTLEISYVSNLKSLDGKGLEHLTSLQQLQISGCESLKFLPKEGLPASLSSLKIRGCPSLKKRYGNKKGKDWRNIARLCSQMREFEVVAGPNAHPHRPSTFVDTKSSKSGVTCTRGGLPPTLQTFWIENCERLRPSVEWGLQGLASLREFWVQGNKDPLEMLLREQLLLATHSQSLDLYTFKSEIFGRKGLEHLTSLQQLQISSCEMESSCAMSPLENFRSGEVRICWRHCSNNSGSLPLAPSGLSSLKSVDQNTTHSQNSCPEKDLSSSASLIVLHSCQKRICRHLFLFHGPSKCLFFSEQEICGGGSFESFHCVSLKF
ncbi:hypothetical protein DVH24_038183 [Malus domestica]|uniref:Uncharacterized protein n=1 Tax=Malus domestica TaxID=3750 RepID=A0A498K6L6_MALDO|nr:hypothetical protein DVH24_038183 [Malus domestica]